MPELIADVLQKPDGKRPRAGVIFDDGQISDGHEYKRWCRAGLHISEKDPET